MRRGEAYTEQMQTGKTAPYRPHIFLHLFSDDLFNVVDSFIALQTVDMH